MIFKLGDTFNKTFIITEATFQGFMHLFNDRHPLHTNEQFAIDKGFKGKVMHGCILNGFLSYFIGECLPSKNIIIHSLEMHFKNVTVNAVEFKYSFKNTEAKIVAKGKFQIGLLK